MPPVDWLIYHPIYCAVICQPCGFAAYHPGLHAHLLRHHLDVPLDERRALVAHYQALPLRPSDDFRPPPEPVPPIAALPLYRDGYRCSICRGEGRTFVRRRPPGIRDHCREAHGWVNPLARGRKTAWAVSQHRLTQPWVEGVPCQRLFLGGRGGLYFEVAAPPPRPPSGRLALPRALPRGRAPPPPPVADRIQVRIDREQEVQAEQRLRTQEDERSERRYSSEVNFYRFLSLRFKCFEQDAS